MKRVCRMRQVRLSVISTQQEVAKDWVTMLGKAVRAYHLENGEESHFPVD